MKKLIKRIFARKPRKFTYRVDQDDATIIFRARSPIEAAMKSGEFAKRHHMLLVGPLELATEKIYR